MKLFLDDTANVALCEHGLNGLIAGIRCDFFSKLAEGAYVRSIARREPRRLPACLSVCLSVHSMNNTSHQYRLLNVTRNVGVITQACFKLHCGCFYVCSRAAFGLIMPGLHLLRCVADLSYNTLCNKSATSRGSERRLAYLTFRLILSF